MAGGRAADGINADAGRSQAWSGGGCEVGGFRRQASYWAPLRQRRIEHFDRGSVKPAGRVWRLITGNLINAGLGGCAIARSGGRASTIMKLASSRTEPRPHATPGLEHEDVVADLADAGSVPADQIQASKAGGAERRVRRQRRRETTSSSADGGASALVTVHLLVHGLYISTEERVELPLTPGGSVGAGPGDLERARGRGNGGERSRGMEVALCRPLSGLRTEHLKRTHPGTV